jgi:PAS domain-containing protein
LQTLLGNKFSAKRKKVFSLDSLPNIVLKFDAEGRITRANTPASAFFARPAAELRGAHLWTQLAARFDPDSIIAIRLAFEEGRDASQIVRTKTGNRWLQVELMMDGTSGLIIFSPLTIYPSDRTSVEQAFGAKLAAIENRFRALIDDVGFVSQN